MISELFIARFVKALADASYDGGPITNALLGPEH